MNRLGFTERDFPTLLSFLKEHNEIKIASVFSHLATSDMPEMEEHTQQQLQKFRNWSDFLANELNYPFIRHILNTSGIYNYPAHQYDRSEEHTSELQSRPHLVCRLLLEKKNKKQ